MIRANIHNHSFDRMGGRFPSLIDADHFLGHTAFDVSYHKSATTQPPANVRKEEEFYELELAIPGYSKDEIEITVNNDILTIRGEKTKSSDENKSHYILEEFNYKRFERQFFLAPGVGHERITAHYDNGILRLTFTDVPPAEEKAVQTIEIK